MASAKKFDPARGWLFVQGLILAEEAKRLDSLTEEELEAELRAKGVEVGRVPTAEELLAKARLRAEQEQNKKGR
jgi:hypothetical protein